MQRANFFEVSVCKFFIILDVLAFKKCPVWLETHDLENTNSSLESSF